MNLMLILLLGAVVLGLSVRRFGRREDAVIAVASVMTATLYFFVGRFM
jgi:hypothetical protein